MDDGRRNLDHVTEDTATRRARLRALALARGYHFDSKELPDAAEIMHLADGRPARSMKMTRANRPRLRAFLLGIDPGT